MTRAQFDRQGVHRQLGRTASASIIKGKVKGIGKSHPRTDHEVPNGK